MLSLFGTRFNQFTRYANKEDCFIGRDEEGKGEGWLWYRSSFTDEFELMGLSKKLADCINNNVIISTVGFCRTENSGSFQTTEVTDE